MIDVTSYQSVATVFATVPAAFAAIAAYRLAFPNADLTVIPADRDGFLVLVASRHWLIEA